MSLESALARVETELEGLGLHRYAWQLDQDTLEEAQGLGTFDDGYHMRVTEGPSPFRELCENPTIWDVVLEIQVATQIKNLDDRTAADVRLGVWMAKIQKRLVWGTFDEICKFFEQSRSLSITRDGQRLVQSCRFVLTYEEAV